MEEGVDQIENCRSWCVAIVGFFINCLLFCVQRTYGLIYVELVDQFNIDRDQASVPLFMNLCLMSISGPITGFLGKMTSPEIVVVIGCVIASASMGANYFAEDILAVVICLGVLLGIGCSATCLMIPSVLQKHFKKNYNSAGGICQAGSCCSAFVFPPITTFLFQRYGFSGSLLILSGVALNSVCAAIFIMIIGKNKRKIIIKKNIRHNRREQSDCATNDLDMKALNLNIQTNVKHVEKNPTQETLIIGSRYCQKHIKTYETSESSFDFNSFKQTTLQINMFSQDQAIAEMKLTSSEKDDFQEIQKEDFKRGHFKNTSTRSIIKSECQTYFPKSSQTCDQQSLNAKDIPNTQGPISLKTTECAACFGLGEEQNKNTVSQTKCLGIPLDNLREETNDSLLKTHQSHVHSFFKSMSIFSDKSFLIIMFLNSSVIFFMATTRSTLLDYSRDKRIDRNYEAYILMSQSIFDMIGRLALVWVVDKGHVTSVTFTILGHVITALSIGGIVWSRGITMLIVAASFLELSLGALVTVNPGILIQCMEKEKITIAMPCRQMLFAPLSFTSYPLIGYFRNELKSYDGLYYLLMAFSLICALMAPFVTRLSSYMNNTKKVQSN